MNTRHAAAIVLSACLLVLGTGARASAQTRFDSLFHIAVHQDGSDAVAAMREGRTGPAPPIAVRMAAVAEPEEIDRLLPSRAEPRGPLWLVVDAPPSQADVEPWRAAIRRLLERAGDRAAVLEVRVDSQPADVVRFAVQLAAVELRARRDEAFTALGGPAMGDESRRSSIYTTALAPYVDLLSYSDRSPARPLAASEETALAAWVERVDAGAGLLLTAPSPAGGQPVPMVQQLLADLGTQTVARAWDGATLAQAQPVLAALADVLVHPVTTVDAEAVGLELRAGGDGAAPPALGHRLLFDTSNFSTLLFLFGEAVAKPLSVTLRVPLAGTPSVSDLRTGSKAVAAGYRRDETTERTSVEVVFDGRPMLINFNEGAEAIGERGGVTAEQRLSVDEIISRHRRQQLAQDRALRNYMADAHVRYFLTPQLTDPGYDLAVTNRYFFAEDGVEWEQLTFAVNNRRFDGPMPMPMIQPEKVFTPPLQLRFGDDYTYRLEGTATVDGFDCYEVGFEPTRDDPSLYRGTVWIDRRTFARIRLRAVQGGLPGMVISNDETQHYAPVAVIANQSIFLPVQLTARQIWLFGGRNLAAEKTVTFTDFRLNDDAFVEARTAARRSDHLMYRETENGLRSYVKRGEERVISDRLTESVKAMALGVVVDPSYQFPLPIFGINYIDFSFGDDDTQLAMLFAGVLAAGNIQRPHLFGSKRLSASLDFFAIAAPSSDRIYEAAGELEAERVLTWPMTTGLNVGFQATPFQKWSLQYQFRFDAYVRDTTTAESYQLPSSTVTNGIGGQWEYSRSGYTAVLNAAWFARGSWKAWGGEAAASETSRSYAKYSATLSRVFLIDAFQKVSVNGAWFGGRDLDRFVRYQFGLFDATRIRGVPAAARFGELAMARGSYSVNVFDQYRLDLFLDHGWGRDARGEAWQRIPGIGSAFNLPGPWNTIVRADVGRSWLPSRYGSLGSTSLQVMLLKPLR